jgi:hypothetical protein
MCGYVVAPGPLGSLDQNWQQARRLATGSHSLPEKILSGVGAKKAAASLVLKQPEAMPPSRLYRS